MVTPVTSNPKRDAAQRALEYVESGMILGLGTGSTAKEFVDLLGGKLKSGELKNIKGVPTSEATAHQALNLGIPLVSLDEVSGIDLAIDGADEVDSDLNLIKGLGKALLREKLVEIHASKFIVIVDESKMVETLGTKGPLPVEITKFGHKATLRWLNGLGCRAELWLEDGKPAETDNGNYLAKCWFEEGIVAVTELAKRLDTRPGVVEHGLFLKMATKVIVAGKNGVEVFGK